MAARGYPDEYVYYFEPLKRLPAFIETTRGFFTHLPAGRP